MTGPRLPLALPWAALLAVTLASPASAEVAVTECGQVVERNTSGVLTGDLDCSGYTDGPAVTVEKGTLDLAGFTLTGATGNDAVACLRKCIIVGPGTIEGADLCVNADETQAEFRGIATTCAGAVRGTKLKIYDSALSGIGSGTGVSVGKGAFVDNTTIESFGSGVRGQGSGGAKVKIRNSVVCSNTYDGVYSQGKITVYDESVVCDSGEHGLYSGFRDIKIKDSSVIDNGWRGAYAAGRRVTMINAEVDGNCLDPSDTDCRDVVSCKEPIARNAVCGTSWSQTCLGPAEATHATWGICSLD